MEHHRQPGKRRFGIWQDWLVIGLIVIGGILCGVGVGFAFGYGGYHWRGGRIIDWYPWWGYASGIASHFATAVVVLAAARYWFRRRPSDSDPGA